MQQVCLSHGQEVEYFRRNDQEYVGLCKICILSPPFITASELYSQIDQKTALLLNGVQEQAKINENNMSELILLLMEYKNSQLILIEKLLEEIQQFISIMAQESSLIQNQVTPNLILNEDQLHNLLKKMNNQQSLNDQKSLIQNLFETLRNTAFFKNCDKILTKVPFKQNLELETITIKQIEEPIHIRCQSHDIEVVGVELKEDKINNNLYCLECLAENPTTFTSLEQTKQWWQNYQERIQNHCKSFSENLQIQEQQINKKIAIQIEYINGKANQMKQKLNQLKNVYLNDLQNRVVRLKKSKIKINQHCDIHKLIKINKFLNEENPQVEKLLQIHNSQCIETNIEFSSFYMEKLLEIIYNIKKRLIKNGIDSILDTKIEETYEYQLPTNLPIKLIKQKNWSCAMSFSKDNKFFVASCEKLIKVFEFNHGSLREIQQLRGHTNTVGCLQFIGKEYKFVSCGKDKLIKVWSLSQDNIWEEVQSLNGHSDWIFCLISNSVGNLIVSGCCNKEIKFWKLKYDQWHNSQTLEVHQGAVCSLSLNEAENKLVSCGDDKLIVIFECNQKNEWEAKQQIQVELQGNRICFINDGLFAFQPILLERMFLYQNDGQSFKKAKEEILVQLNETQKEVCLFPQIFNKQKNVLISKNGQYVNIIRQKKNGEFKTDQSIQFNTSSVYGTLTDDGEYLLTWDKDSQNIQVRQFTKKHIIE